MDKKYRFNKLSIEITRRCNKRCKHCAYGEAQDLSMDTAIIDRLFDDVADVKHIALGNGEVLLEVNRVSYFIDKLAESPWTTSLIEVTTNGTICDPRIVDIFEKFCSSGNNRTAIIRISNDIFHDAAEYERAFAFYQPLVDEANRRISPERRSMINVRYTLDEKPANSDEAIALRYSGRAIELVDNSDEYTFGKNVRIEQCQKHRIKIIGTDIPCDMQISANGDVVFGEFVSYTQMDEISIGNINEQHLTQIIDQHNDRCMVLCSEAGLLHMCKEYSHINLGYQDKNNILVLEYIYKGILRVRDRARQLFPHIPAQDIIERIPFPDNTSGMNLVFDIYKHCPYYTENLMINLKKYYLSPKRRNYMGAMYIAIVMYLKDKNITRKWPYWLFGTDEDVDAFIIRKFADYEEYCELNPDWVDNNKAYLCEPNEDNAIDYTKDPTTDVWSDYLSDWLLGNIHSDTEIVFNDLGIGDLLGYESFHDLAKDAKGLFNGMDDGKREDFMEYLRNDPDTPDELVPLLSKEAISDFLSLF